MVNSEEGLYDVIFAQVSLQFGCRSQTMEHEHQ